jgi:hypothetical protein
LENACLVCQRVKVKPCPPTGGRGKQTT